ncbi:MAG TPA: acyl carrier protein [Paracoccaceae bacterium]|nr:acyl carrier protein [Paracoccaceae bacterium]
MTRDEIRGVLIEELGRIAPEIDATEIDPAADLREQFEIDSMDVLTLVTALHKRLGVDVPEADYARLSSLDAATDYLAARLGARP